ncbi:hypothetical protein ACPPVS_10405 [Cellulomonas sp. McL0617]|uniref:hypothetical protein n=1 Tax=Cellulomonas sp. McL0617 TaxID=3415675 RepID=UPI003CF7B3C8
MPADVQADRGLLAFVVGLVAGLDASSAARVRRLAGSRSARIGLDDESVDVSFGPDGSLRASSSSPAEVACRGRTDRRTVLDLLGARLEVRDAVLSGWIEVVGPVEDVAAIFAIVEVLLAASVRLPALQVLAGELAGPPGPVRGPAVAWYPDEITAAEVALLSELDLMSDGPAG